MDDPSVWVLNPGSSTIKGTWYPSLDGSRAESTAEARMGQFREFLGRLLREKRAGSFIVRFVHGGAGFFRPVLVTADMLDLLDPLRELAPLHTGNSIAVLRELLKAVPRAKLVAVFDTEFFHDLPETAMLYGLPWPLMEKYGIRRYGFHGFAHAGMQHAWESRRGAGGAHRLVTIQLGSGCSMAAILGGRPVDTTMGFTPNEGLLMSTRCGDVDSGLVTWLQRREKWTPEVTDQVLNEASGWLGLSEESADMGDLLESASEGARRAVDFFAYRVRKTLGSYHALLGGLDGVVLSGGIAERAIPLCRRLLAGLEHLGIRLDGGEPFPGRPAPGEFLALSQRASPALCGIAGGNEALAMLASAARSGVLDARDPERRSDRPGGHGAGGTESGAFRNGVQE